MCELFGMSSNEPDRATRSLPIFASKGSWCQDGWGIGYYNNNEAVVQKFKDSVIQSENAHPAFLQTIQKTQSSTILAHVRAATSNQRDDCDSHPFIIRKFERNWIFAHNGSIPKLVSDNYRSYVEPYSEIDSARAFSFIMDKVENYLDQPGIKGLYPAIKNAVEEIRREMGGGMNFLLSDGSNLYVFNDSNHSNEIYYLQRRKSYGYAFLVTTISSGLSNEDWMILPQDRLLVLNRGEILVLSNKL